MCTRIALALAGSLVTGAAAQGALFAVGDEVVEIAALGAEPTPVLEVAGPVEVFGALDGGALALGTLEREQIWGHYVQPVFTLTLDGAALAAPQAIAEGVVAAEVAPGGERIVFIDAEQRLHLWDGANAGPLPITRRATQVAWLPDGSGFVFTGYAPDWSYLRRENPESPEEYVAMMDSDICLFDFATREVSVLVDSPMSDWNPVVSPDGAEIVFSSTRSGYASLYRLERATGEVTCLHENSSDQGYGVNLNVPLSGQMIWSADGETLVYATTRPDLRHDIWCVAPDGSGARVIGEGTHPQWVGESAVAVRSDAGALATLAVEEVQ